MFVFLTLHYIICNSSRQTVLSRKRAEPLPDQLVQQFLIVSTSSLGRLTLPTDQQLQWVLAIFLPPLRDSSVFSPPYVGNVLQIL